MPNRATPSSRPEVVADRLHSAAIHLLRRLRRTDDAAGLSPARLSVLSVLVFGGSKTIGELADAEQVTAPTMSNLVSALQREGFVRKAADRADGRVARISTTARGRNVLDRARRLRLETLARELRVVSRPDLATLDRAARIIQNLSMNSR